jgi:uncharacterized protein YbjT (DUF2867 family)
MRRLFRKLMLFTLAAIAGSVTHAAENQPAGILILGGTRGLGLETVKLLDSRNESVAVMARSSSNLTELNKTRARQVTGDAGNTSDIDAALAIDHFRVVVASLPGTGSNGSELDVNAIDAATHAGISHFILISSVGVGDSREALPWIARVMLRTALKNKEIAERRLIDSGMPYTIIRPGNLTNKQPSGKGILTEDRSAGGAISRAEAARLIYTVIKSPEMRKKTYAAIEQK